MKAVVVSHGEVDPADVAHVRGADLVIAADGGSEHLRRWGIEPHLIVGDLDSLSDDGLHSDARVEPYPSDKDQTDTELAVDRALAAGADEVVVIGALGGRRIDHAIANTLLLAREAPGRGAVRLVKGPVTIRVLRGGETLRLSGTEHELVSLFAVGGDAQGITTSGLGYPLDGETLHVGSSRGVSNVIDVAGASIRLASGTLLVIEGGAPAAGSGQQAKT